MKDRIEVWAQCVSAVGTFLAAVAAAYTAYLVYGQLEAAQITLHADYQYRMYNEIQGASQRLASTLEDLDAANKARNPSDVQPLSARLKVQLQAFDGLIGEARTQRMAGALSEPHYMGLLLEICPGFKSEGYMLLGQRLEAVSTACRDLDQTMEKVGK
ncbi:hypothetical protein HB780_14545 [Rhizobium lusitanum]|uniref:hypothetical protein n=1 Tax=Rhizobium lusitanum TaxID=293958 RepID=UPI00161E18A6|nr:hypothetical protein [Rhizobium lusitanum]QND46955.1 hypothetical protein HB780_14545 [Rhizobium lusitanum]